MSQPELPKLNHALIKVVGVFKYSKKTHIRHATERWGYKSMPKIILPDGMQYARAWLNQGPSQKWWKFPLPNLSNYFAIPLNMAKT